jgi:hypothetical protein
MRKSLIALVFTGCLALMSNKCEVSTPEKTPQKVDYFAEVPMYSGSGMSMISGDFDKDGDLDLIVGSYAPGTIQARLYFLENDGNGNFTKREYLEGR